jgi:hypothetical protein
MLLAWSPSTPFGMLTARLDDLLPLVSLSTGGPHFYRSESGGETRGECSRETETSEKDPVGIEFGHRDGGVRSGPLCLCGRARTRNAAADLFLRGRSGYGGQPCKLENRGVPPRLGPQSLRRRIRLRSRLCGPGHEPRRRRFRVLYNPANTPPIPVGWLPEHQDAAGNDRRISTTATGGTGPTPGFFNQTYNDTHGTSAARLRRAVTVGLPRWL